MNHPIRPRTVSLIAKILKPLSDEGLIQVAELREIISNLRHLSSKGTLLPVVVPRLVSQEEAASTLGIGLSNFKKLERSGMLHGIRRRMVGSSVRFLSTELVSFVLADDGVPVAVQASEDAS